MSRFLRSGRVEVRFLPSLTNVNALTAMDVAKGIDLSHEICVLEGWTLTHQGRSKVVLNDDNLSVRFPIGARGLMLFAPRGIHSGGPLNAWPSRVVEKTWGRHGRLTVSFTVECQCNCCSPDSLTWRAYLQASKERVWSVDG